MNREERMDTTMATTRLEGAIQQQVIVAGGDPEVEAAARAILSALGPAVRQLAFDLAEQAAAEVAAQLPGYQIEVVLASGEPTLRVRSSDAGASTSTPGESLDARITFRLPPTLKDLIETAAEAKGESVNTWLVKTVSTSASDGRRRNRRITGTIET
jgi:predicted HicB family RNase H-like nuclease